VSTSLTHFHLTVPFLNITLRSILVLPASPNPPSFQRALILPFERIRTPPSATATFRDISITPGPSFHPPWQEYDLAGFPPSSLGKLPFPRQGEGFPIFSQALTLTAASDAHPLLHTNSRHLSYPHPSLPNFRLPPRLFPSFLPPRLHPVPAPPLSLASPSPPAPRPFSSLFPL